MALGLHRDRDRASARVKARLVGIQGWANLSRRRPAQKAPRGGLLGGDFLPVVSVLEVRG